MATQTGYVMEGVDPNVGPLIATINPQTGETVITHASREGGMFQPLTITQNTQPQPGLLEGNVLGIPKTLILVGALAFFFFKDK
jgi:hypothetical protein